MPVKALLLVLGLLIVGAAWWKLLRVVEAANGTDWGDKWLNRLDGLNHIFCRRFQRGIILLAQMTGLPIYPMQVSGVRGKGRVVMALWLRSYARVSCYSALHCQERDDEACLQELWRIISPGSGSLV